MLTTQQVNRLEIEALTEELAVRPVIEAAPDDLSSGVLEYRMMDKVVAPSPGGTEIREIDIDQLNKKGLELLGQQVDLRPDESTVIAALSASRVEFTTDGSDLLESERAKFDKALNLLETRGLEELETTIELLTEAFAGGHNGSGFVLAHLLSPNQGELIYRELILRLTRPQ